MVDAGWPWPASGAQLGPGAFDVAGQLVVPNHAHLSGAGRNVTTLTCPDGILLGRGSRLSGLTVVGAGTGIGIDATNTNRATLVDVGVQDFDVGYHFANAWIVAMRDCYAVDCATAGIRTGQTVNALVVDGGELQRNRIGALLLGTNKLSFRGVTIEASTYKGLAVADTVNGLDVTGCYFEQNTNIDIHIAAAGRACHIRDSLFLTTPLSVAMDAGYDASLSGCYFRPEGAGAQSVRVGVNSTRVHVGRNHYAGGVFDPAEHDAGTDTTTE